MGALVAFEIARIIEQTDPNALGHLFVAARVSPDTPATGNRPELLNDAEFIAHLMSYQNEGEQIAMDPELLGLCLPTIRADFEIVGTYAFKPSQPLRCPIIAFGGSDDHGTPTQALIEWRKHTTGPFLTKIYRGGHFFLKNNGQRIIADIASARDQLREESLAGRMSATRALPASFGVTG
jgi:surfactin synthase thioesterase subunit